LKIIQVTPFYHPVTGGVESIVKSISEELAKRGHEITVYTYNIDRSGRRKVFESIERINGVTIKRVTPFLKVHHGSFAPQLLLELSSQKRIDLIHAHGYRHPHTEQVWMAARKNHAKTLLHGHSPFYGGSVTPALAWAWYKAYDKIARHMALKYYDRIIALTPIEKKELIRRGCKPEKIEVIPNPLPNEEIVRRNLKEIQERDIREYKSKRSLHGYPIVLYLGRIAKTKRIEILIRSLPYLLKQEREAQLILAGQDEHHLDNLIHLSKKIGVRDRIRYLGFITEREKTLTYLSSDVYVLPSPYEGFGLTLLEAQAHGLPVVVFEGGGQEYAVSCGLVLKQADPAKLAEAMLEASRLEANFEWREHSVEKYVDKIISVYEDQRAC